MGKKKKKKEEKEEARLAQWEEAIYFSKMANSKKKTKWKKAQFGLYYYYHVLQGTCVLRNWKKNSCRYIT